MPGKVSSIPFLQETVESPTFQRYPRRGSLCDDQLGQIPLLILVKLTAVRTGGGWL